MFRQLSKITLKYTSSLFSHYYSQDHITPKLVELWLKDMQIGLDALLDDQIILAEDTFSTNEKSPFHAFGYALLVYMKAMLAMERSKIEQAIDCVLNVEILMKRFLSMTRKKTKSALHSSFSAPIDIYKVNEKQDAMELQFELLFANCILMSATLQFLKDSWIDHLKAAYDLRKAYKIYERLFETITGITLAEYETTAKNKPRARRTVSCDDGLSQNYFPDLFDETIEHGAYFGIGLFNVIFSLLPIKVGKILNSLGFHSSRSTAISLLQKSYKSQTMYSSLSSLVLLTFYTNISIYIQPKINEFFQYKDASEILERMKSYYPNGQIWSLIQGKLRKGESSILLFEKAKNANHGIQKEAETKDYFRNASITEFIQFRSFAIYELGWSYIYAGNYFQASESFFCLESMCNWSRLFYHYMATCCMIADELYDKSVLEIRQMINMIEQRKKVGSSNEQFAESRIKMWIETSIINQTSLKETLQKDIINPIWELVYLWNGISYFNKEIIKDIKDQQGDDPMIYLLKGVVQRDVDINMEQALEYFNMTLITAERNIKKNWIIPYAMYEIAATHFVILQRDRSHTTEYQLIILDWIKCIENYYQDTLDIEWETRMQLKCQLLFESCNSI